MLNRAALLPRALVLTGVGLISTAATGEEEIYSSNDGMSTLILSVDVLGAAYRSQNSWFGESASFLGENTDNWADFGFEPKVAYEQPMGMGTFFGQVSWVYTNTFGTDASGVAVGLDDTAEFTLEQGHIGWRREDLFDLFEEDTFTVTVGRQDYNIGTGLLINDGGGDGGERGGWYLGMRKAFSESIVASIDSERWLLEGFTLKNRPRAGGTQGEVFGTNVEYKLAEETRLGGTYMSVDSNLPGSADLDAFSARVDWQTMGAFGFSGEYVDESSSQIEATGYYGQVSFTLAEHSWMPVFSYRYAHFDGDDPTTLIDERFREIAYGYTDWGTWYQGEITGEYALGNGNLDSHMLRARAQVQDDVAINVFSYNFTLDQPTSFGVTSDEWGDELNFIVDWQASDHLLVSGVFAMLFPGDGAEQFVGGSDDWYHAMLYFSYSW